MAIREYKCNKCGIFESIEIKTTDKTEECPKCGSKDIERIISSCNSHFHGTGFYKTDYVKPKEKKSKD